MKMIKPIIDFFKTDLLRFTIIISAALQIGVFLSFPRELISSNKLNAEYAIIELIDIEEVLSAAPESQAETIEEKEMTETVEITDEIKEKPQANKVKKQVGASDSLTKVTPHGKRDIEFLSSYTVEVIPRVIKWGDKKYPPIAREQGREGLVVLEVYFDEQARIVDIRIIREAGYGFDEAAIVYVRTSLWEPALHNGKPVPVALHVPVRFALED